MNKFFFEFILLKLFYCEGRDIQFYTFRNQKKAVHDRSVYHIPPLLSIQWNTRVFQQNDYWTPALCPTSLLINRLLSLFYTQTRKLHLTLLLCCVVMMNVDLLFDMQPLGIPVSVQVNSGGKFEETVGRGWNGSLITLSAWITAKQKMTKSSVYSMTDGDMEVEATKLYCLIHN